MSDLDKFKQIFDTCSIWRGGGTLEEGPEDGLVCYNVNIALDDPKGGYHKEYAELLFYFDFDGKWVKTTKSPKAKRR